MACGNSVYYLGIKSVKSSKFLVEESSVHFVNIYLIIIIILFFLMVHPTTYILLKYLGFIFVMKKYDIRKIMTPY